MVDLNSDTTRRDEGDPKKTSTELTSTSEEIVIGKFSITFKRPDDWCEDSQLKEAFRGAWSDTSKSESLIIGYGTLERGVGLKDIAASPISNLTSRGFTVPVVIAIPIIMQDGSHAFSINYPATSAGIDVFKYAYLKEVGGHWCSMEFIAQGKGLNYVELIGKYAQFLSTFKVTYCGQGQPESESPQISPPQPTSGRMPETSIERLKEYLKASGPVSEFTTVLLSQPGELTSFQTYNLMEVVVLSDRSIQEKVGLLEGLGQYVAEKSAHLRVYTPTSEADEQAYLQKIVQIRSVFETCSRLQDALSNIATYTLEFEQKSGIAGLQDNLRETFQKMGIPTENREGYTDLAIPGRDFLSGRMEG